LAQVAFRSFSSLLQRTPLYSSYSSLAGMLAVKILISLLVASALGEQVKPSCEKDTSAILDDTVSLFQSQLGVKSGISRSKPEEGKKLETAVQDDEGFFAAFKHGVSRERAANMLSKGFAELVAMTLFVFIGCGSAMANKGQAGWEFQVSLTFGFAITVLAYSIGHISGGQINCAVTFGLLCSGNIGMMQAMVNVVCQLIGSVLGSCLTHAVFGDGGKKTTDKTGGLGTNGIAPGFSHTQAFVGEVMGTFILMFTVLQTAISPGTMGSRSMACMAIGLSVFLAHCVLIPVDGCSINPTRTFGPMVVNKVAYPSGTIDWGEQMVFWVGPLVGAACASGVYCLTA